MDRILTNKIVAAIFTASSLHSREASPTAYIEKYHEFFDLLTRQQKKDVEEQSKASGERWKSVADKLAR
jgi:hypothetical protein